MKEKIKESRATTEKQVIRKSPRKRSTSSSHPIGRRPQPIRMERIGIYREDQPIGRPFYPIGWKSLLTQDFFIKDCDFINPVLGPSFQYSNHSTLLGEQEKHLCT